MRHQRLDAEPDQARCDDRGGNRVGRRRRHAHAENDANDRGEDKKKEKVAGKKEKKEEKKKKKMKRRKRKISMEPWVVWCWTGMETLQPEHQPVAEAIKCLAA